MKDTTPITPQKKKEIIDYFKSGHTVNETYVHFKVDISTVYKILRDYNIDFRIRGKVKVDEVRAFLEENPGLQLKQYAAHFSISSVGMLAFFRRNGIDYKKGRTKMAEEKQTWTERCDVFILLGGVMWNIIVFGCIGKFIFNFLFA